MAKKLRLGFHRELSGAQQEQAMAIYYDTQNWRAIVKQDIESRWRIHFTDEKIKEVLRYDAKQRDTYFSGGQICLLWQDEQEWKTIGTIHTVVTLQESIQNMFPKRDTWNEFTTYGRLSSQIYNPLGTRWACFAIQTDKQMDKEKVGVKPADIILKSVRLQAYAQQNEYEELEERVDFSAGFREAIGTHTLVEYINPLTRLSGFSRCKEKFRELSAQEYASCIERIVRKEVDESGRLQEISEIAKTCSLRYHLSRGARIEKVIEEFRVHDAASLGYGASVLYAR